MRLSRPAFFDNRRKDQILGTVVEDIKKDKCIDVICEMVYSKNHQVLES